jgi:hypothetical protein
MYDPTVGRFITEDPIGFDGGDLDLYRYVGNSPTNETDPSGLASRTVETGIKGIKLFIEWFPNQATGEIKVLTKRGAELAIGKYVLNPKTGEGVLNIVETHGGKVLPGVANSILKKIEPLLAKQLSGIVEKVGGKWVLTRLANITKSGGRLGFGRGAAAAGKWGLGMAFSVLLAWLSLENTASAEEIPRPEIIWIDVSQLGLTEAEISALEKLVNGH